MNSIGVRHDFYTSLIINLIDLTHCYSLGIIHASREYKNRILFNYSMLSSDGMGGGSSLESFKAKL